MNRVFKKGQMVLYGGRKVEVIEVQFIGEQEFVKFQAVGQEPFVVQF